jgi:membrane-associated protease RseP (regulator of RpoE activity)
LRVATQEILLIADTTFGGADSYFVRFRGRLKMDSIEAYRLISEKYRALGFTPLFRKDGDDHAVLAMKGTIDPPPSPVWVNALMFALTVVSVLYVGASYGYQGSTAPSTLPEWMSYWSAGIPFLASMLGILLAHELGHYFAARYHKVAVTLPYFIPLPTLFGTLGAFIMLKSPPTNRRVLLDIGIAGPLAGLVVAVPILIYGLATSPLQTIPTTFPPGQGVVFEGNSILYIAIKYLVFGKWLPTPSDFGGLPPLFYMLRYYLLGFPLPLGGLDVTLNALAWAGWGGLLVTGMNLIPAGQLDGGHALYVLIGKRARLAQPIILVVLIALGFFYTGWFIWAALIFFVVGRAHAEPLDQITEVDGARKFLAVLALVLFFLVITPIPLTGSAGI